MQSRGYGGNIFPLNFGQFLKITTLEKQFTWVYSYKTLLLLGWTFALTVRILWPCPSCWVLVSPESRLWGAWCQCYHTFYVFPFSAIFHAVFFRSIYLFFTHVFLISKYPMPMTEILLHERGRHEWTFASGSHVWHWGSCCWSKVQTLQPEVQAVFLSFKKALTYQRRINI